MNEYQALLEELKIVESKLCPPQREISELEHLKARFRLAFEQLFDYNFAIEELASYSLLDKDKQNLTEEQLDKLKTRARESLNLLEDVINNEEKYPWEILVDDQRMDEE